MTTKRDRFEEILEIVGGKGDEWYEGGRLLGPIITILLQAEEALKTAQQAALETNHAQSNGSGWYTNGASALYQRVKRWTLLSSEQSTAALEAIDAFRKGE